MLNLEKLERARQSGGKVTARCPACAEESGADRSGTHLVYWPESGKFACSANAGDREHRREIWRIAGIREDRPDDRKVSRAELARVRREREEERRLKAVADAARGQAQHVFAMDWPEADLWEESPVRLDGAEADWRMMLERLYAPGDVLWIGEPHHSGEGFEDRFHTRNEWLSLNAPAPPFPMTCPNTLQPGVSSRAAASVAATPFIVVEADEAIGRKPVTAEERAENVRRNLAVIRWLKEECQWTLRALVHTGGKSCHGWFEFPGAEHVRELRAISPALGIDASVFTPAHPVRLPGVRHEKTGAPSRLLWLAA